MSNLSETSDDNFANDVLNSKETVLVDFYAPWCGPCKTLAPMLEEIAKDFKNTKFYKINVDENPQIAQDVGVNGVPTIILYKLGKEVQRQVGLLNKEALKTFIQQ